MGGDLVRRAIRAYRISISTHAPAWGATASATRWKASWRFLLTPRVGGDPFSYPHDTKNPISTHAPAWGATCLIQIRANVSLNFYSRPRIGGAHTGAARRRQKPACDSRERGIGSQSSTAEPVLSVGKRVPDDRGEGIRLKADPHAAGHLVQFHHGIVIPIAAGIRHRSLFCDLDQIEQLMSRRTAQLRLPHSLLGVAVRANVFENDQRRNHRHLALAGRAVMLVHIQNRFKENIQIFFVKARFLCQIRADKAADLIQAEGDDLLAAHGAENVRCCRLFHLRISVNGLRLIISYVISG